MILSRKYNMWSVIATLIVVSCAVSLHDGYSRLRYGHRLDKKMIDSFCDYSLLDCVEACLRRKRCRSVSYHGGSQYCEINYEDKTTAPTRFLESRGWTYSERNDWDRAITGPCASSNCAIYQTCRSLPSEKYECVLSDCGIPYIRGADMDSVDRWDGIAIGRQLHLQCLNQYEQIGSGRLVCSTDGQWIQDLICGCNVGWLQFQNKCYYFSHTANNWTDAAVVCSIYHSKLAEPRNAAESNFLMSQSQSQGESFWIGISDVLEEGRWEYSDQTVITVNDFGPGEPNMHTIENCVVLWPAINGQWADYTCSSSVKFVCEMNATSPHTDVIG